MYLIFSSVLTCCFAPCGWLLASGDSGGEIIIWDIHAGNHLYCKTAHDMGVNCILFSTKWDSNQGQHTMISAGSDCSIYIWNITTYASKWMFCSVDGYIVVYSAGAHGSYRVTMVKEHTLTGHTGSVCNCSLSLDNKLLASA